ncbi:unnamed protein product [marine sediment metagenome]|uniref:DUF1211 domain-containing protein n=1 Tax=marine sediment metagenome TaxID=412755 RepID=X0VE74_9ZZZZ
MNGTSRGSDRLSDHEKRNLNPERLWFFSDGVVAIIISIPVLYFDLVTFPKTDPKTELATEDL